MLTDRERRNTRIVRKGPGSAALLVLIWHVCDRRTTDGREVALRLVKSADEQNQVVAVFRARGMLRVCCRGQWCKRRNIIGGAATASERERKQGIQVT
jgi:SH3-like domain-containing protein